MSRNEQNHVVHALEIALKALGAVLDAEDAEGKDGASATLGTALARLDEALEADQEASARAAGDASTLGPLVEALSDRMSRFPRPLEQALARLGHKKGASS